MTVCYRLGDKVQWRWGNRLAHGKIASIHTSNITKIIDGAEVSREAGPGRPAYTVKKDGGGLALVARHEIAPAGDQHEPRTSS